MADLAGDPAWSVTVTGTTGQWLTAERVLDHNGRRRLIGLTPIRPGVVALMQWCDGEVVDHARGSEAEMCTKAHRWVTESATCR